MHFSAVSGLEIVPQALALRRLLPEAGIRSCAFPQIDDRGSTGLDRLFKRLADSVSHVLHPRSYLRGSHDPVGLIAAWIYDKQFLLTIA